MNDKYKILCDTLFPDICVEIHDSIKPKNTVALIMFMYDSSWVLGNFTIIIMVKNGLY
jgi:hypothetical protein